MRCVQRMKPQVKQSMPLCLCRRMFLHHYTEFMDAAELGEAAGRLAGLAAEYRAADGAAGSGPVTRLAPQGGSFL